LLEQKVFFVKPSEAKFSSLQKMGEYFLAFMVFLLSLWPVFWLAGCFFLTGMFMNKIKHLFPQSTIFEMPPLLPHSAAPQML
jgi:hypothetical protein